MNTKRTKVKLDENYQIEIDEFNFALLEKNKNGKMRRNVGFYPTLELLVEDLYYHESKKRMLDKKNLDVKNLQLIYLGTKDWLINLVESLNLKCDTSLLKLAEKGKS